MAYKETQDEDLGAVVEFYKSNQLDLLHKDTLWEQIEKNPEVNVTFKIEGSITVVASKSILTDFIEKDTEKKGVCLITGKKTYIIRTATPTPIPGCQSSASLVSFQKNSGYDSYGKEQGYNAPISLEAEFAFSTAFKKLIEYNSHNTFTIDARTYVFWSSLPKTPIEEVVHSLGKIKKEKKATKESYRIPPDVYAWFGMTEEDDPNRRLEIVSQASESIYSGKTLTKSDDKFYILGMSSASKGRIAVTYWNEIPVNEFAGKLLRHFKDMEIIDNRTDKKPYTGLYSILESVVPKKNDASEKKSNKVLSNLLDAVAKSIFQGLPYPISLFQLCIRRIRAEICLEINGKKINPVNTVRAAIIKAYLNRLNNKNKKITVMLDKENNNQGYLCGRLFAALEKIQEDAKGIHSIRERFMNSASATPAMVFATILNLSNHHLEKLNDGYQIFYEKLKQEIISKLDANGFPVHLDLQDQGRFFVGYYHQRQDFFISKENKGTEEEQ